jgi:excisionase family DNA binding protein
MAMNTTDLAPQLYSLPDLTIILNVSLNTIERIVAEGAIRSVKVRGRRLVSQAAVDDYIAQLEQAS